MQILRINTFYFEIFNLHFAIHFSQFFKELNCYEFLFFILQFTKTINNHQ